MDLGTLHVTHEVCVPLNTSHLCYASPHSHTHTPSDAAAMQSAEQAELLDLHRRVSNLEQQVQRLTETVVRRDSSSASAARGNSFWYALTFAGWVMVPLVVVYMFHYRKGI